MELEGTYRNKATLEKLREEGMIMSEMADELNTSIGTIHRWMKKHDIPTKLDPKWIRINRGALERYEEIVYVLTIIRSEDSELFYYVGKTEEPIKRMKTHNTEREIAVPNTDGEMCYGETEYEIVGLKDVIDIYGFSDAKQRNVERRTLLEVAIDEDTTNVLGGR